MDELVVEIEVDVVDEEVGTEEVDAEVVDTEPVEELLLFGEAAALNSPLIDEENTASSTNAQITAAMP